jgi:hypothetical protein
MSDPALQPLVGISLSESPDLDRLGFGQEHLTEMMIAVARTALRLEGGATGLVYGGDLRGGGFTRRLFDIALSERRPPSEDEQELPRRIYNYLAWPYYLTLAKCDEAQMINACHFMRVRPSDAGFDALPADRKHEEQRDPPAALVASRCLTRMRELSTRGGHLTFQGTTAPRLRARIMLGGKTTGYSSLMPGLFEEFLVARETGPEHAVPIPVYVIGAFGGAAGRLAAALLDPDPPARLTLDHQLQQEAAEGRTGLRELIDAYAKYPELLQPEARYAALREVVEALGQQVRDAGGTPLDNGLTPAENRRLLQSRDEVEIRRLLKRGLEAVFRARREPSGGAPFTNPQGPAGDVRPPASNQPPPTSDQEPARRTTMAVDISPP